MKNKSKVLSYTCRCFLAIPAILMILHHCGIFTMTDNLVRITGILLMCSLFAVGYFTMRMRSKN